MTGRTRADMLTALTRSRAERAAVLDLLLNWQNTDDTERTLRRLDQLDTHIDGLLADYLTLGPREAP